MAVSVNLAKALDKAYEDKSVNEILDAPVSAISGVSAGDAALLVDVDAMDVAFGSHFAASRRFGLRDHRGQRRGLGEHFTGEAVTETAVHAGGPAAIRHRVDRHR